jgi:hypothetical protein
MAMLWALATGHAGMTSVHGESAEHALTNLASPRDLTAGWSYTALSRARGETRLLVYDREFSEERSEFAPTDHAPKAARDEEPLQPASALSARATASLAAARDR